MRVDNLRQGVLNGIFCYCTHKSFTASSRWGCAGLSDQIKPESTRLIWYANANTGPVDLSYRLKYV